MKKPDFNVHIIGAGVAGITAGWQLQHAGINCTLFEKSRGVGGRLSTRRTTDNLQFDHGAQYFTARSPEFTNALEKTPWVDNVKRWQADGAIQKEGEHWFVGVPAMKSPLKDACDTLDIRMNATVEKIERAGSRWQCSGENVGDSAFADIIIISAPAPQAHALTPFSHRLQNDLTDISYDPCWALMAAFGDKAQNCASVLKPDAGVFSWIARNSSKPDRESGGETWVAHASPAWSQENLELDKEQIADQLLPYFLQLIGGEDRQPIYLAAHRWRYARVAKAIGKPYLSDETGSVFIIGDGCLGPRVECAFESGMAAANHILKMGND